MPAQLDGDALPVSHCAALGSEAIDGCVQAAVSAEAGDAESAAKAVAMHAQKQHTRDDVSVIALVFKQAMQRNDG